MNLLLCPVLLAMETVKPGGSAYDDPPLLVFLHPKVISLRNSRVFMPSNETITCQATRNTLVHDLDAV